MPNKNGHRAQSPEVNRAASAERIEVFSPGSKTPQTFISITKQPVPLQAVKIKMEPNQAWQLITDIQQLLDNSGLRSMSGAVTEPVTLLEEFLAGVKMYDDLAGYIDQVHNHCVHHSELDIDNELRCALSAVSSLADSIRKIQ